MSVSIIEQIAEAVREAVNSVEGVTALRPRRAWFLDEITAIDQTVVIEQDTPERLESTLHTVDWDQPFNLLLLASDSDAATAPIDTRLNELRSRIERALLTDETLGGLAIGLRMEGPTYYSTQDLTGVLLRVVVHYRTAYADPYQFA